MRTCKLSADVAAWAQRRQGRDGAAVTLERRRVYILPTRYGVVFGAVVFAMLLGSLNYGASLGFALTFLLAGLALVIMHHCHGNLRGTHVRFVGAPAVFVGQRAQFRIALDNRSAAPRYELELAQGNAGSALADIEPGESALLTLDVGAGTRGWLALGRFAVATRHPGSLFRAWTWVHMDARCLVYPSPAPAGRPPPATDCGDGTSALPDAGDADFGGLRAAAPGDPPQRLAWKAFARTDELLIKQFTGGEDRAQIFEWDALADLDREERLAQLTRWCLDAARDSQDFGLRLPVRTIPLGRGDRHLHECLRALALFDAEPPA